MLCGDCQNSPKPFDKMHLLGWYQSSLKTLMTRFKYHQDLLAGRALTQAWLKQVKQIELPECLIPVPMHRHKLAVRGFNQAALIAHELSRALGVPVEYQLCQRVRLGQASIGQTKQERLKQVKHLYQTCDCHYSHVAIVDDVVTSQATAQTLAAQLIRKGAKRVDVWALARTP